MLVRLIDKETPRCDGQKGKPSGVTIDKLYWVMNKEGEFFRIRNDHNRSSRYFSSRFEEVDKLTGRIELCSYLIALDFDEALMQNDYKTMDKIADTLYTLSKIIKGG